MPEFFIYQEFTDPDFGAVLKCVAPEGYDADTPEEALHAYADAEFPQEGEYVVMSFGSPGEDEMGMAMRLLLVKEVSFTVETTIEAVT